MRPSSQNLKIAALALFIVLGHGLRDITSEPAQVSADYDSAACAYCTNA